MQTWTKENRLDTVTDSPGHLTQFTYDGDGQRVKKVGYQNLAAGRVPTSNGTLRWPSAVTNGDTWAESGLETSGEFAYTDEAGLRYVQLDLGGVYTVDQVTVWHWANDGRTYHNTKTEVSADGVTWTPVFDSALAGEYQETAAGQTSTFSARSVLYVRDYLNGSTSNAGNHWVEIEVWGTATTVYVGGLYEKNLNSGEATSYYYAGSQRVAMRQGTNLLYFVADHLGSTSVTLDASGTKIGEMKYYAVPRSAAEWVSLRRDAVHEWHDTNAASIHRADQRHGDWVILLQCPFVFSPVRTVHLGGCDCAGSW